MKIAQVCPRYCPYIGGVETHVREISERLTKEDFEVEVLTTDPSGKLPKENIINSVKVKRFKSLAPSENYHLSRQLKKYLSNNSEKYDVIHAHSYHDFPALYAAEAKRGNKLVFNPHYHGAGHNWSRKLLHIPYRFMGKRMFQKADKVICVSNHERSLVLKHFKLDGGKVIIIPDGISGEEFKDIEKRRKDYSTILYVGRLEKYKGVQYLIKVLPMLANNITLEVVGKGPYKQNLIKLAKALRVQNKVRFFEHLSRQELLQKYSSADLFLLLSRYESYGISVAEALASKTPCVVANVSALKEWVDNESCFGIDYPVDIDKLAKLTSRVIGGEVKEVKLLDWNDVVERLEQIYNTVDRR